MSVNPREDEMFDFRMVQNTFRQKAIKTIIAANCGGVKHTEISLGDDLDIYLITPEDKINVVMEIWELAGLSADNVDLEALQKISDIEKVLKTHVREDVKKTVNRLVVSGFSIKEQDLPGYIFKKSHSQTRLEIECILSRFNIDSRYIQIPKLKNVKSLYDCILRVLRRNS